MSIRKKIEAKRNAQEGSIMNIDLSPHLVNNGVASPVKHTFIGKWDIFYDDETHIYFATDGENIYPLVSATTVLHMFQEPFDEDTMSLMCAKKSGYKTNCLDKTGWRQLSEFERADRIKIAWKQNNVEATDYGTATHMACEYLASHPDMSFSEIYEVVEKRSPEGALKCVVYDFMFFMRQIIDDYKEAGYEIVTEPVLFDISLGIAGQADLVCINHEEKVISILDYKTNKTKPTKDRAYSNLLDIYSHLPDTSLVMYALQLSIYAHMIKHQYPDYEVNQLTLLWLNRESGEVEPISLDINVWNKEIEKLINFLQENVAIDLEIE